MWDRGYRATLTYEREDRKTAESDVGALPLTSVSKEYRRDDDNEKSLDLNTPQRRNVNPLSGPLTVPDSAAREGHCVSITISCPMVWRPMKGEDRAGNSRAIQTFSQRLQFDKEGCMVSCVVSDPVRLSLRLPGHENR